MALRYHWMTKNIDINKLARDVEEQKLVLYQYHEFIAWTALAQTAGICGICDSIYLYNVLSRFVHHYRWHDSWLHSESQSYFYTVNGIRIDSILYLRRIWNQEFNNVFALCSIFYKMSVTQGYPAVSPNSQSPNTLNTDLPTANSSKADSLNDQSPNVDWPNTDSPFADTLNAESPIADFTNAYSPNSE